MYAGEAEMPEGPRSRASRARSGTIKQARTPCGCVSILLYDIAKKRDYTKVEVYTKKEAEQRIILYKRRGVFRIHEKFGQRFRGHKDFPLKNRKKAKRIWLT